MKAIVLKDNKRFLRKTQIDLPYYSDRDECFESVEEAKKSCLALLTLY